jgi:hypothetical protein
MGLGSIISQTIIEHRELIDLDWDRIIRFAAFGYLFSVNHFFFIFNQLIFIHQGPFVRYWYYALEKLFSNTKLKPIKMMFADQVRFSCFAFFKYPNG